MNEWGNDWGLTERGFRRPTYPELLDAAEAQFREQFGGNVNLTVRSIVGIFMRIWVWFWSILWKLTEDVYNSSYIDTAVGVSLARLGTFIGIRPFEARKSVGFVEITGTPGAVVPAGWIVSTEGRERFVTLEAVRITPDGKATARIQALIPGYECNVAPGTITHITTPITGITAVTNHASTSGGRTRETDEEFRDRYRASFDIAGGCNTDAIRAELLRVDYVDAAVVFENETDESVGDMTPHSIEAIVFGGDDAHIAAAIHKRKSAGIQTIGNTMIYHVDASGEPRAIYFSRPVGVMINIRVYDIALADPHPVDWEDQIKKAFVEYIGGPDTSGNAYKGLPIGRDVMYNRLPCVINRFGWLVDYKLEVAGKDIPFGREKIPMDKREKATTTLDRIEVRM